MVLALIYFDVKDAEGFEAALKDGSAMFVGASGYRDHKLRRGVEQPDRYLLTADWARVEDHQAWQKDHAADLLAALAPFMNGQPDIQHFE